MKVRGNGGLCCLLAALILGVLPVNVFAADLCGPVMHGAVLNVSVECLNDATAMVVDRAQANAYGWQYTPDGLNDGVSGAALGPAYEIFGMAFKETATDVYIVINANIPAAGYANTGAANGSIAWSDLFINLSGNTFLAANNARQLFGIRFASNNDSAAPSLGVYRQVDAKSVTAANLGFASYGTYAGHVTSLGGTAVLGSFGAAQTYYDSSISLNEIQNGVKVGDIVPLTIAQLQALNYNTGVFAGTTTIAFRYTKSLIIDRCGVIGGNGMSCVDCAGNACGTARNDDCGVCNGGNRDKGCDNICFSGKVVDDCGQCGGLNRAKGCDNVCFSGKVVDDCGQCGGLNRAKGCDNVCFSGKVIDDCGQCGGLNRAKGCDNVCFSAKVVDDCGQCGGLNRAKGCDNVCFSGKVIDDCGQCGGLNAAKGCDGICFSGSRPDDCGECNGQNRAKDCSGQCFGDKVIDDCGVCGGLNGDKGCDAVCYSGKQTDLCGICGGDGSSCGAVCTEEPVSSQVVKQSKKVKRTAKVLRDRVKRFADYAEECSGKDYQYMVTKADQVMEELKTVTESMTGTVTVCPDSVCTEQTTATEVKTLRRINKKLYKYAKNAKLTSIDECNIPHHEPTEPVKTTEDYRADMIKAIKGLPVYKLNCETLN